MFNWYQTKMLIALQAQPQIGQFIKKQTKQKLSSYQ